MQFSCDHFAGARSRTGVAVAESSAIIGADAREFRDLRLHLAPGNVGVAEAGLENDSGGSLPGAVDVHLVPAHVDESVRAWD